MAHGTWEDFTSKWGFSDGNCVDGIDFDARKLLVKAMNAHPAMVKAKMRVLELDPPTCHNSCVVIRVKADDKSDEQLLEAYESGKLEETSLPDAVEEVVEELICEAYEDVYAAMKKPKKKKSKGKK
jgi:hypothetical protein